MPLQTRVGSLSKDLVDNSVEKSAAFSETAANQTAQVSA